MSDKWPLGFGMQEIKFSEVQKHNKEDDAWTVIHGNVVNVTDFLQHHPGGKAILQQFAGKVCSCLHQVILYKL
jgi:cytochrome b involved in lipid metabolism